MNAVTPRSRMLAAAFVAAAPLIAACGSGPSGAAKKAVNNMIAAQNFTGAEAYIEKNKESQYKKKNLVLFYLDKGMVQHHAGKYQESDTSLGSAEQRMEELYTKSVTKTAGMLVLSDNTVDYAGEPFERALTNVVRALNWVFMGKTEEALVESRKVEVFLDELNNKLETKLAYKDDAFARYLDALLYADMGKMDDARISMQKAMDAYGWYAGLYGTAVPQFAFPDDPKKQMGELVFIHYNGVAPRKVTKTWQIAWGQAIAMAQSSGDAEAQDGRFKNAVAAGILGNSITVAYPAYVQDPFEVAGSEVVVNSEGPVTGETLLMEDISGIATKNLEERIGLIKTRAIARATIKYVIAKAAADAAAKACDRQFGSTSWQGLLCKAGTRGLAMGVAAASEVADTRCWGTLPAQIRMARLKVAPGKHTVTVNFKNAAGVVVQTATFNDVEIERGKRKYLAYRTAGLLAQGPKPGGAAPAGSVPAGGGLKQ